MEIVNYLHITQDQIWRKLNISWYELLLVSLSRFDCVTVHYIWDPWYPFSLIASMCVAEGRKLIVGSVT